MEDYDDDDDEVAHGFGRTFASCVETQMSVASGLILSMFKHMLHN